MKKLNRHNMIFLGFFVFAFLALIGSSYAFYGFIIDREDENSTILIGSAVVEAEFVSNDELNISDAFPSKNPIGYKDFQLNLTNTSNEASAYHINLKINRNDFNDVSSNTILYYEVLMGSAEGEYTEIVTEKSMVPTTANETFTLYKGVIPAATNSAPYEETIYFRINIYFPMSPNVQNAQGAEFSATFNVDGVNHLVYRGDLKSIAVSNFPLKTEYIVGETFDAKGLKINATFASPQTKTAEVYGYTISPSIISSDTEYVTISYTENGKTVSTTCNISVSDK